MAECNMDDILCQIKALRGLRDLQSALGNETFSTEFPELMGLDEKISNKIVSTKGDLKTALAKCGNVDLAAELEGTGLEEENLVSDENEEGLEPVEDLEELEE